MSDRAERPAGRRPGEGRDGGDRGPAGDAPTAPSGQPDDGPTPLRLAVLALWVEAGLIALLGVAAFVRLFLGEAARMDTGIWLVVVIGLVAVALWISARLLIRRRQAGQGLAISLQLAALPVAFFMTAGDGGVWVAVGGVAIGLAALSVTALLLAPSSRAALPRR